MGMRAVSFTSWYSLTVPLFVSGVFGLVLYVTDDVMSSIGMRLLTPKKKKLEKCLLGFRLGGIMSNMSASMLACMTQLLDVSFRAVTRTEYL